MLNSLPFPGCKSAPGPSQRRAKFLEAQRPSAVSFSFVMHITSPSIRVYPSEQDLKYYTIYIWRFLWQEILGHLSILQKENALGPPWPHAGDLGPLAAANCRSVASMRAGIIMYSSCINMIYNRHDSCVVRKHYIVVSFSASEDIFAIPMNAFERGPWHDKNRTDAV